jgi:CheY-like chemotaxis protein
MNRSVLFVEDEELLRTIYRRQTQGLFDVETAAGPAEALAAVAAHRYSVIVTDRSMPGMDGLELAAAIRQTDSRAVLMLLTAHAGPALDGRELKHMFRVLSKPCPRDLLIESLEAAVALYHSGVADVLGSGGLPLAPSAQSVSK